MKNLKFLIVVLPFFVSSCAKSIQMSYPKQSTSTGTVVLKPNMATEKTSVWIDSNQLVFNKKVRSVTINNVPAGNHSVRYSADNTWYVKDLDLQIPVTVESGEKVKERIKVKYNNWVWAKIGTDIALGAAVKAIVK